MPGLPAGRQAEGPGATFTPEAPGVIFVKADIMFDSCETAQTIW